MTYEDVPPKLLLMHVLHGRPPFFSLFEDEFSTINTNINGTHYLLSAVKEKAPECKFYFAGSSEMFGLVKETPQNENTPFHPRSPYGISKVAGFDLTRNYREAYNLFACSGILFNHESPRRRFEFVNWILKVWPRSLYYGIKGEVNKLNNVPSGVKLDQRWEILSAGRGSSTKRWL